MVYWVVRISGILNRIPQLTYSPLSESSDSVYFPECVPYSQPGILAIDLLVALHFDTKGNHKRVKLFWMAFTGMFIYEVFPSYIFPLLNGFSIVCLATQHVPQKAQNVITNFFGGSDSNEGLGCAIFYFLRDVTVVSPTVQFPLAWLRLAIYYLHVSSHPLY